MNPSSVARFGENYDPERLRRFAGRIFEKLGMPADDAALLADHLVWADLRGHSRVGIKKIPQYYERFRRGLIAPVAQPVVVHDRSAFALVDAGDACGPVVGVRAMDMAIERARGAGIGLVVVRDTTTANAMGYFALRAATQRMIGLVINNSPPVIPPPGGKTGVVGVQAFAIAAPAGNHDPIVLDMTNSAMTKVRMEDYLRRGEELPSGVALSASGEPTVDPAEALLGFLAPMGGPRGFGLALMWEVLTGVLAGGPRFAGNVTMPDVYDRTQGVSLCLLAIDPEAAMPYDTFVSRVDELIDQVHASDLAPGTDRVTVPGERSRARAAARERDGIPITEDLAARLRRIGSELGVTGP